MANNDLVGAVKSARGHIEYKDMTSLWHGYEDQVLNLARRNGVNTVAELGGGANPFVGDVEKWGFAEHRIVVDISAEELEKAPDDVETRVADLCRPINDGLGSYNLVFSKMLCEHLPNPRVFHENCFKLLRPGGLSVHFFPTLFTFPFLVNKLMPEDLARSLLDKIQPGRLELGNLEKFPAYYRWTSGPTRRARRRFESVGFEVEAYHATFGHHYYHVIKPLDALERAKANFLLRHPAPGLTSFAVVVLRKPA
jgi:SAM-dependent methyltransferase